MRNLTKVKIKNVKPAGADTMSKISWKENSVLSIETREGVFVLAQMLKSPYLMFFNVFSDKNKWEEISLDKTPELFCLAVTRQFLSKSTASKITEVSPKIFDALPSKWIQITGESRFVSLWENTPYEKKIIIIGNGGSLIEKSTSKDGKHETKIIKSFISFDDDETIDRYELTSLGINTELNERLYLCYKSGRNVNPYKDLVFNRQIPLEYKNYIDIISS